MNLSVTSVEAYWSELEKIAVNTVDLLRRTRHLPGVSYGAAKGGSGFLSRADLDPLDLGGAYSLPTKPQLAAVRKGYHGQIDQAIAKAEGFPLVGKHVARVRPDLEAGARGAIFPGLSIPSSLRGQIGVGRIGQPSRVLNAVAGNQPHSGPRRLAEHGAIHGAITAHELFERGTKPRDMSNTFRSMYGHQSPGVLMKEHNLLSKLEGPGAGVARGVMRGARKARGEDEYMRNLFQRAFKDPRAGQFLEEGRKVPKAMRKKLLKMVREDPDLLSPSWKEKLLGMPSALAAGRRGAKEVEAIRRGG